MTSFRTISYFFISFIFQCLSNSVELFETDSNLSQRVWTSIKPHVINDLQYLKSLATSIECKQKIEDAYIEHVSYSVIRKDDSYSFDLQNQCHNQHNNNNKQLNNKTNLFLQKYTNTNTNPHETLRIVYFILMHQHAYQAIRLISTLNTSNDVFLIHLDNKSLPNITSIMSHFSESHSNIHLMEQREVTWGGFSIIDVQLKAMKYAIQCLKLQFDFFMILSESDYPLASVNQIKSFLNQYRGKTLMRKLKPLNHKKIQPYLQDIYCECDNALYHVGRRELNENKAVTIYSSSLWSTYHYEFIQFVVENDDIVPDYINFFRPTAVSDETFFGTLLMNSPLCNTYVTDIQWNLWRLELWPFINTDKSLVQCKHADSNIAFCGTGPIDIISEYLPVLQSTKALFARKFNPIKDNKVLNILDNWRNNSKPKLLENHKLILIKTNENKCLTVLHEIDYESILDVEDCIEKDEMQMFMLTECTDEIYLNDNQCLQSKKQFGKAFSICEIRGVVRNDENNLYESNDECLSIIQTMNGVQIGARITMDKCVNDGFSQKFYFNECGIKYASPLVNYLAYKNQNLCVGFCNEYMPCLQSCNETNNNVFVATFDG